MILSESKNSRISFLHLERFVNDGSPSGFSEQYVPSPQTRANGAFDSFYLPGVNFTSDIQMESIGETSCFGDNWQMFVHPDMIDDELFRECAHIDRGALCVAPTASGRTVMILDEPGGFIKLNYKGVLGRIDRQLSDCHARSAIEVSQMISAAADTGQLPPNFYFLRETGARVAGLPTSGGSIYEWGMVYREPIPYPANARISALIPAFALFSKDRTRPNDPTILRQLAEHQSKPAIDFVFADVLAPLLRSYFALLVRCGLQLEAHAQNILFAIDSQLQLVGVVARDAESIDKDISLMNTLGINHRLTPMLYKSLSSDQHNYKIMHSFMFDFKLGEYLVAPMVREATRSLGVDAVELTERIRELTRPLIAGLPSDFFPADGCWYSYANIVHDRSRPRPYISTPNPRFR